MFTHQECWRRSRRCSWQRGWNQGLFSDWTKSIAIAWICWTILWLLQIKSGWCMCERGWSWRKTTLTNTRVKYVFKTQNYHMVSNKKIENFEFSTSLRVSAQFPELWLELRRPERVSPPQPWCRPARLVGVRAGTERCSGYTLSVDQTEQRDYSYHQLIKAHTAPPAGSWQVPCKRPVCPGGWAG